jgi:hypothetical protein
MVHAHDGELDRVHFPPSTFIMHNQPPAERITPAERSTRTQGHHHKEQCVCNDATGLKAGQRARYDAHPPHMASPSQPQDQMFRCIRRLIIYGTVDSTITLHILRRRILLLPTFRLSGNEASCVLFVSPLTIQSHNNESLILPRPS